MTTIKLVPVSTTVPYALGPGESLWASHLLSETRVLLVILVITTDAEPDADPDAALMAEHDVL